MSLFFTDLCNQDSPNICPTVDHHHWGEGSHPQGWHQGPKLNCERAECRNSEAAPDEKLNAAQEDLAKEGAEIADWWVKTAMADAERTVPKAIEYGSADFDLMGQFMVALLGDKLNGADDAEKMRVGREMAVTFYLIGKLGRAVGAYAQGVLPSDDTIFDTRIYAMMWERIRENGYWIKGQ